ncbi:MFS transporter [Nocardioides convexus]|uniref:MFS transporter n=1 Tax=Nocardioides convexus TaxID=2712224 RepID=UPI002418B0C6|nr:MFS transporter [Nocardioides convexus]
MLVLGPRLLTEGARERRTRLDVPGAVSVTGALLLLVLGATRIGEAGASDPLAWGALGAGVALLVVFLVVEGASPSPLVPLGVLRRRSVLWGNLAGIVAFATETSLVFLLTLYLQDVQGFSPLQAGLSFAVLGIGTVLGGLLAPRVIAATSPRTAIVAGLLVQAAATASLLLLGTSRASVGLLLVATFVGGVANLVAIVGFMVSATSGLPDTEQGLATGLANMSTQVGITIGIPVMGTVLVAALGGAAAGGIDLLGALRTAIGVNAGLCLVAAVGVLALLRPARR